MLPRRLWLPHLSLPPTLPVGATRLMGPRVTKHPRFRCDRCDYFTDRKNNLKRHCATMHDTCDKVLECCGITFGSKAEFRDHVRRFHRHGYTCSACGKVFSRKALLRRHLATHSGVKEYKCEVCDYASSHKSNLERHRRRHSAENKGIFPGSEATTHVAADSTSEIASAQTLSPTGQASSSEVASFSPVSPVKTEQITSGSCKTQDKGKFSISRILSTPISDPLCRYPLTPYTNYSAVASPLMLCHPEYSAALYQHVLASSFLLAPSRPALPLAPIPFPILPPAFPNERGVYNYAKSLFHGRESVR